jgi:hypothetical protein
VRLPVHGRRAARRVAGVEAALVDRTPIEIVALDPADVRVHTVQVAGVAALLVAKAHKLGERTDSGRPARLNDKDALDVLRLMRASDPYEVASTLSSLRSDPRAGASTEVGVLRLDELFGRRGRPGIAMAARALRTVMPEERVAAICVGYMRVLLDA